MLEGWTRDFTHAARGLLRAPVFTLVTVATLALAIGANTAIFSVVKAVLLEPLPFPNAERLISLGGTAPGSDLPDEVGVPDELYFEYRENVPALEDLGMYGTGSSTTRAEGHTEQLFLTRATPSVFTTLGARPFLGRLPTEDDDDGVVVISHWLWQSWFGSDTSVVGRSYDFARGTRTIIGVMGPEFRFPDERVAFWVPLVIRPAQVTPGGFGPRVVARMAPGTDHAGLEAQLAPFPRRVQERLGGPATYARNMERYRPVVVSLDQHLVGNVARPLWVILGTVGIIFLIACANVANLFTVRAESRRRDLAVRRALGAGRASLIRTQMAEALLLATTGGVAGVLIAWAGIPMLLRAAPESVAAGFGGAPIPRLESAGLDLTTLLFTAGLSILAACAFGLVPAIRFSGAGVLGALRQAGRGVVGRSHLMRDTLVVVQTASALVLLVGSALLIRSFWQLSRVDPGFDTENIFTFQIAPTRELNDRASVAQFLYGFMERLSALPGVESVGLVTTLPLDEGAADVFITTPRILASGAEAPRLRYTGAGGAYFQTMGIELLRGRYFERIDEESGVPNVIVSRAAAELLFPGEDPLGQRLRPANDDETWYTVVGVVEDVLLDDFRRVSPEPMVYLPALSLSPAFVMRSARADQLANEVRAIIREVIPESPMYRVFTMRQLAANSMASLSFTMLMLGIAAALALILGAVGLYGVLSYAVSQRTREIGIRMALGAEARALRRMVVAQGGRIALLGVVIGVIAGVLLTDVLESLLFGVDAVDVPTFAAMSAIMIGVALLASYIPARRASSMNPMQSLRAE
jgi:predicted permease